MKEYYVIACKKGIAIANIIFSAERWDVPMRRYVRLMYITF